MDRHDILHGVQAVVREVLDAPTLTLTEQTEAVEVGGWDSLRHVRIILAVEARFGIRFDMDEIQDLADVGALVDLVAKHLAAQ